MAARLVVLAAAAVVVPAWGTEDAAWNQALKTDKAKWDKKMEMQRATKWMEDDSNDTNGTEWNGTEWELPIYRPPERPETPPVGPTRPPLPQTTFTMATELSSLDELPETAELAKAAAASMGVAESQVKTVVEVIVKHTFNFPEAVNLSPASVLTSVATIFSVPEAMVTIIYPDRRLGALRGRALTQSGSSFEAEIRTEDRAKAEEASGANDLVALAQNFVDAYKVVAAVELPMPTLPAPTLRAEVVYVVEVSEGESAPDPPKAAALEAELVSLGYTSLTVDVATPSPTPAPTPASTRAPATPAAPAPSTPPPTTAPTEVSTKKSSESAALAPNARAGLVVALLAVLAAALGATA